MPSTTEPVPILYRPTDPAGTSARTTTTSTIHFTTRICIPPSTQQRLLRQPSAFLQAARANFFGFLGQLFETLLFGRLLKSRAAWSWRVCPSLASPVFGANFPQLFLNTLSAFLKKAARPESCAVIDRARLERPAFPQISVQARARRRGCDQRSLGC